MYPTHIVGCVQGRREFWENSIQLGFLEPQMDITVFVRDIFELVETDDTLFLFKTVSGGRVSRTTILFLFSDQWSVVLLRRSETEDWQSSNQGRHVTPSRLDLLSV